MRTLTGGPYSVNRKGDLTITANSFATLETRGELEQKLVPQLFLGSLLGHAAQLLANFSPVLSNGPRSLCESSLGLVSSFIQWPA